MLGNTFFLLGLLVAVGIGFVYFRDLGDVSQMIMRVKRRNMIRFIRHEYRLLIVGLGATALMALAYFVLDGGTPWLFWPVLLLVSVFYGFPWIYVHLGLRNQMSTAKYYSIDEAKELVSPSSSMVVIEKDGFARAHPDSQILRPHLAGNEEGLNGENVVMTYCAMANLGIGYTPVIEGKQLDLEVLAQHGNNLILRDNTTGEPIQHIYGYRDKDGATGSAMKPWPTFRMSFRGFQKAYPEGTVFLNKPSRNPLVRLFDMAMDTAFTSGIARQHNEAKPLMNNMTHFDDRLPNKTYVWGIDIGDDAVCYTDDFIGENKGLINATIGGRDIVVAYDPIYESVGAWYNDSGIPVTKIDFFGNSDQGQLKRVETLKSGMFWHVWVEFFQHTGINRIGRPADSNDATPENKRTT
ncbi:MAG: DUF3179 domain-containing (seleno)protein [Deltaproteobacteria bacterium]|jgi:hypothetical protein|nr:DUF3179 domain-containing (seleno)protein [Deltaproteobacteria bacterium]